MARKTDEELIEIAKRIVKLNEDAVRLERELFALEREDSSALRHFSEGGQFVGDAANDLSVAARGIALWVGQ
jgi:hypothetical protein